MIVCGLGNPGEKYRETRHNIGFRVVDLIAERWGRPSFREKFHAEMAVSALPFSKRFGMNSELRDKVLLLKPQTFMNLSGTSVSPAAAFFKVKPAEVLVIHDELDLPFGRLQLKAGGGSGGHNGLKSVGGELGSPEFLRLRVGIGRPPADFRGTPADFVLQAFAPAEAPGLVKLVESAAEAVELLLTEGLAPAMNRINRRA